MPKLYEYFGRVVYFYANEQGNETKAEFVIRNGRVVRIIFRDVLGRRPLTGAKLRDFKALARFKADDIVRRWVDFHVLRKHNDPERITRKLK